MSKVYYSFNQGKRFLSTFNPMLKQFFWFFLATFYVACGYLLEHQENDSTSSISQAEQEARIVELMQSFFLENGLD